MVIGIKSISENNVCDAANYDNSCCTPDKPCGAGKGDCDSDDDCIGSLVCGTDNCGEGYDATIGIADADCCYAESESGILKIGVI